MVLPVHTWCYTVHQPRWDRVRHNPSRSDKQAAMTSRSLLRFQASLDRPRPTRVQARPMSSSSLRTLLGTLDFVPQAVLAYDIIALAKKYRMPLVRDSDDFDEFYAVGLHVGDIPVVIRRYRGHNEGTF